MSLIFLQTRVSAVSRRVEKHNELYGYKHEYVVSRYEGGEGKIGVQDRNRILRRSLSLFPFLSSFVDVLFSSESGWKSPNPETVSTERSRAGAIHT
jgi:hypothetical protein